MQVNYQQAGLFQSELRLSESVVQFVEANWRCQLTTPRWGSSAGLIGVIAGESIFRIDILATHCADAEVCASSGEAARLCSKTLDAEDL